MSVLSSCGLYFFNKKSVRVGALAGVSALAFSSSAWAVTDYTTLTGAIDLGTAGTAVMAVFALLAALYGIMLGGKIILGVIRGRG
jgi:hypothetical protein